MRNNLLIFVIVQLFLALITSVLLIYLHLAPALEGVIYGHFSMRLIPVILVICVYLFAGKFMNVKGVTDGLLLLFLPALIWGVFLVIGYFGGGSEGFLRGAFRSLWRFPVDIAMLPQMAAASLLRLKQTPAVYAALAIIPQGLALLAAATGPLKYRYRRDSRRHVS
ncbi:MAG: hypothetical protein SOW18_00095 [Peptoniphilus sp.]|nr:hypothetical protein [Peptoniphilus sp.]MDY3117922.1 hypothetical protein [Peptoniphilus sp.]